MKKTTLQMANSFLIVQIFCDIPEMINNISIVPANWLITQDKMTYVKYPTHLKDNPTALRQAVATRVVPKAEWPKFSFICEGSAFTFNDALMHLEKYSENMNLNRTHDQNLDRVLQVETIPEDNGNQLLMNSANGTQGILVATENNNDPSLFERILERLNQIDNQNIDLKKNMHVLCKKMDNVCIQVEELKQICKDKKTAEELAKLLTIDQLLMNHDIKKKVDPECTDPLSKPVFTTFEAFRAFDEHESFMKEDRGEGHFIDDLEKYFHTIIDTQKHPKEEIRKILKIFFDKNVLRNHYTGDRKIGNKLRFKETNFYKTLEGSFIREYADNKFTANVPKVGKVEMVISDKLILSWTGDIITHCPDWVGGRAERSKK